MTKNTIITYIYYDYWNLITKFWPGSTKWNTLFILDFNLVNKTLSFYSKDETNITLILQIQLPPAKKKKTERGPAKIGIPSLKELKEAETNAGEKYHAKTVIYQNPDRNYT